MVLAQRSALVDMNCALWFEREIKLAAQVIDDSEKYQNLASLFDEHICFESYEEEIAILKGVGPESLLFVGCGACPMTSYVISDALGHTRLCNVDRSETACLLASHLLNRFGLSNLEVKHADARALEDLSSYDCILLALTVGTTSQEKADIVRYMAQRCRSDAVIAIRTGIGWARLIYPVLESDTVSFKTDLARNPIPAARSALVVGRADTLR